jgi:hypothetical protein
VKSNLGPPGRYRPLAFGPCLDEVWQVLGKQPVIKRLLTCFAFLKRRYRHPTASLAALSLLGFEIQIGLLCQ